MECTDNYVVKVTIKPGPTKKKCISTRHLYSTLQQIVMGSSVESDNKPSGYYMYHQL